MNKHELIEFIKTMPDDLQVYPIEHNGWTQTDESPWEGTGWKLGNIGSIYQKNVSNDLTLRLFFTTTTEGEFFRRTNNLMDRDGEWHNLKRVK